MVRKFEKKYMIMLVFVIEWKNICCILYGKFLLSFCRRGGMEFICYCVCMFGELIVGLFLNGDFFL